MRFIVSQITTILRVAENIADFSLARKRFHINLLTFSVLDKGYTPETCSMYYISYLRIYSSGKTLKKKKKSEPYALCMPTR